MLGVPWEVFALLIICALLSMIAAFALIHQPFIGLISGLFWFACAWAVGNLQWQTGTSWIFGYPFIYLFGFIGLFLWAISLYTFIFPQQDNRVFVEYGGEEDY